MSLVRMGMITLKKEEKVVKRKKSIVLKPKKQQQTDYYDIDGMNESSSFEEDFQSEKEKRAKGDKEKKDKSDKEKKVKTNREIMNIAYIFIGLFVIMLGYFTYFVTFKSKDVINNTYNKRQDLLSEQIVRGDILSADGKVLAYTKTDEEGKETRIYPYSNMFSHIVGRVNKGKTGLESSENFLLLSSNENGIKKIYNELTGDKNIGDNIITTLDASLQEVAYKALGNNKGAVVVMEPSSGKILAMVSKPDYDPNDINALWDELVDDSDNNSALINRATQGVYPPGSIFKILTTLEYIRENKDYESYVYDCVGKGIFNSVTINCYNQKAHGHETLIQSFAKSCNSSYANIGTTLDMNSFKKLCESFLFNSALPTNLVYNKSSFVLDGNSDKSEIPQTVIGQGKTGITPLHSALIVSAIANGGVMMKPYVVDRVENVNNTVIKKYLPELYKTVMTANEATTLTTFMTEVVQNGTASALKNKDYEVAGKTGSAEYETGKPAHAWFVGFAPATNPEIVVSVIVESVGTGSEYAVPVASKIFDAYYNK